MMKNILTLSITLSASLMINAPVHASVAYNLTGWDSTGTGGQDGGFPADWVGGSAPAAYAGSLSAMWYANLAAGATENVSSSDARVKGADPTFSLAVGPRAWNDNSADNMGQRGQGHGSDFGLIDLTETSNLIITVAADTLLGSNIKPGYSLFDGWDTGTTSYRIGTYQNNGDNPLGSSGLTFLDSASTTEIGGAVSFTFNNLAAGGYTLFIGGNYSDNVGSAGKYTVSLTTSPVPVPAALWLFGSALGLIGFAKANPRQSGKA